MKCLSVIPMSECRGSGTGTWIKVKSPSNIDFDIMVDLHQRISVYKYCAHIGRLELFWLTRLCVDQLSFGKSNITLVSLVRNNWTCFFMCLSPTQKKKMQILLFYLMWNDISLLLNACALTYAGWNSSWGAYNEFDWSFTCVACSLLFYCRPQPLGCDALYGWRIVSSHHEVHLSRRLWGAYYCYITSWNS